MKSKTESKWNFLTRWAIAHGLVGFIIWFGWFEIAPAFSWFSQWSVAALMGLLFAFAQFIVLPKRWIGSPGKWLAGSSIGWLISSTILTSLIYDAGVTNMFALMAVYVLPSAIFQSWLLNKHFKRAWLWIGAVLAGALVDSALSINFAFPTQTMMVAAQTVIPALTAIISGSILIYMSQALSRDTNVIVDSAGDERLNRLEDKNPDALVSKSGLIQSEKRQSLQK